MKRKYLLIALGATLPMLMFHYVYGEIGEGSHLEYQRSYNEIDGDSTTAVIVSLDSTNTTDAITIDTITEIEPEIFQYSRFKHYTPKKVSKKTKPST